MRVKVYLIDQTTGAETFEREADIRDVLAGDDPDASMAAIELRTVGRAWIGGGASPLFYLSRMEEPRPNRYRTLYRPAGFATIPCGVLYHFVEAPQGETWNPGQYMGLPTSRHRYGVFQTERPLTAEELRTFEIEPVEG